MSRAEGASGGSRRRVDEIYETLLRRLCTLRAKPGDVLREEELATHFGVSRTPIRQALQRLEFDGLVESRHGVGNVVTDVDMNQLAEVYTLRMRLSELVGDMPAPEAIDTVLEGMRRTRTTLEELSKKRCSPKAFAEVNLDFHELLLQCIGNTPLRETMRRLFHQTSRIWAIGLNNDNWQRETTAFLQDMADIERALEARDLAAVGYFHRNHISMSLSRMRPD